MAEEEEVCNLGLVDNTVCSVLVIYFVFWRHRLSAVRIRGYTRKRILSQCSQFATPRPPINCRAASAVGSSIFRSPFGPTPIGLRRGLMKSRIVPSWDCETA